MLDPGSGRLRCKDQGGPGGDMNMIGPSENEESRIGAIICAVPENPSGTERGTRVCKTSVAGTRLVDPG